MRAKQDLQVWSVVAYVTCVDALDRSADYLRDAGIMPLSNFVWNRGFFDAIEPDDDSVDFGIACHLIRQLRTQLVKGYAVRPLPR